MATTWTDTPNFTDVSGSVIADGSAWPVLDNFDDNTIDTDNWAVVGATVAEQNQQMEVTGAGSWNTRGVIRKTAFANTAGNFARFTLTMTTGFDMIIGFGPSASSLNHSTGVYFYPVSNGNLYRRENGVSTQIGTWTLGVTYTITLTCTATNTFEITIDGGAYDNTSLGTMAGTSCDYFQAQVYPNGTTCAFDNFQSNCLGNTSAQFTVHDTSLAYQDAGEGNSWDLSEYVPTVTGSPSAVTYAIDTSDDSGHTPSYGSELTLAQLQATANTNHRYLWMRVTLTGNAGTTFDALAGDTYLADTTPPAVPSTTKFSLFETDNYALIWVDPDDADFDHCELKRIIDGTTTYLGKNGSNLPEWQASPTTYWTFADDSTAADMPTSAYVDEDVAGTSIAYYVRSVDTSDNASAWTVFSQGSTTECSQPAAPTLVSATPGDGQVTLSVTLNAAGDPAYIVYGAVGARGAWSDPSEDLKLTASGTIDVTGLSNLQEYVFDVVSESGDIYSLPSDVLHATPRASSQAASIALRDATAQAALLAVQHCGLGVQVQYRATPTGEAVDLWASLDAGRFVTQLRRQTETDTCDLTLTIPRQTGWPPTGGIETGSVLIYDSVEYEIDDHEWDRGDPALSASVTVHCGCWRHLGLF